MSLAVAQKTKITLALRGECHTVELTRGEFGRMVAGLNRLMLEKCEQLLG